MEMNSIGLIEMSSIASGMQAADIMLKAAEVELLLSRTICSGKYMTLNWRGCCRCKRGCYFRR